MFYLFCQGIYKKRINNQLQKWASYLARDFAKEETQVMNKHINNQMISLITNQENTN